MAKNRVMATPSIRRLPSYLHIIRQAENDDLQYISGTVIAEELELEPIQVRKDLTITGIVGKPKLGYPVKPLIKAIESFLGWDRENTAFLIGAGSLGTALAGYLGFKEHGLKICAAFDVDKTKIGKSIHDVTVFDISELKEQAEKLNPVMAILTVPSDCAQESTNKLVEAGVKAIWNFTNVKVNVPNDVVVQKEDLNSGYAMLGFMVHQYKTNV